MYAEGRCRTFEGRLIEAAAIVYHLGLSQTGSSNEFDFQREFGDLTKELSQGRMLIAVHAISGRHGKQKEA